MASANSVKSARVVEFATGKVLYELELPPEKKVTGIHANGNQWAGGFGPKTPAWSIADGKYLGEQGVSTLQRGIVPMRETREGSRVVRVYQLTNRTAIGTPPGTRIEVWDAAKLDAPNQPLFSIAEPTTSMQALLSPDGKRLFTFLGPGGGRGTNSQLTLYSTGTGRPLVTLPMLPGTNLLNNMGIGSGTPTLRASGSAWTPTANWSATTSGRARRNTLTMFNVTQLLDAANRGDRQAAADLLPLVYDELRKLAAAKMAQEKPGHTLDATALVHEAYLKLTGRQSFESRSHFLRAAAGAMRRILVDHARARNATKRGGGQRVELESGHLATDPPDSDLEALDEALSRLAAEHPQQAELVQLRFFGGLSLTECAGVLGVSARTADTWWAYARAWLSVEMNKT